MAFLGKYLTFGDFAEGAWEGEDIITWTWNHLWYLPYLLCYTLLLYGNFVFPRFPYINHALIDDWYAHALYGTLFFHGYLIGRAPAFWTALAAIRWRLLVLVLTAPGLANGLGA